jgi:simple sugar transport system permease protein
MFIAVVAAVIGGTSLLGGSGTIMGALIGAIVLSIINDGLNLLGVNANTYFIVLGVAILIAMILNVRLQLLRRGGS